MEIFKRILALIVVIAGLFGGVYLGNKGFTHIENFRKLERIPLTTIMGSIKGEVYLQGVAEADGNTILSPYTRTQTLYYRYLEEEEYRDSDGDRRWRTVRDENASTNFWLTDHTGSIYIDNKSGFNGIHWSVAQKLYKTVGKRRYTEWRIDPYDKISVFGWFDNEQIQFYQQGDYLPIISSFDSAYERSELGFSAILFLWGGITALIAMCYAMMFVLKAHKTLLFLMFITLSSTSLLLQLGWKSLSSDVNAGAKRVEYQREQTESLVKETFRQYGINFPGWQTAFSVEDYPYNQLTTEEKAKLNAWRNTSYEVRERYLRQIARFPEGFYARLRGLAKPETIELPAEQLAIARENLARYQGTKTGSYFWMTLLGFLLIVGVAWFAFTQIRVKRMQENLPTCKTSGVTFGLAEVCGELIPESVENLFKGPVSGAACTWYHYKVEEKRGSGKNSRWVTIVDEKRKQPFFCKDEEGQIRVFPSNAEIFTKHKSTKSEWRKRYTETRLEPDDNLYILGKAKPDKTRGDTLVMAHEKGQPYLIANLPESEVMFIKASRGMGLLSIGVSLLFLCALFIGGSNGNFSSIDFLMASLIAPAFLTVIIFILMFNDIIFLKNRCDRNWSNIQVSLKKRSTLLPKLELVAKKYLEHEQGLMEKLTQLRANKQAENTKQVDQFSEAEFALINELKVTGEAYPDLKGQQVIEDFTQRLIKLENELALIRAGFNDSVMLYNTRLQTFPDNLIAKVFRFEQLTALQFEKAVHEIQHKVSFEKESRNISTTES